MKVRTIVEIGIETIANYHITFFPELNEEPMLRKTEIPRKKLRLYKHSNNFNDTKCFCTSMLNEINLLVGVNSHANVSMGKLRPSFLPSQK